MIDRGKIAFESGREEGGKTSPRLETEPRFPRRSAPAVAPL